MPRLVNMVNIIDDFFFFLVGYFVFWFDKWKQEQDECKMNIELRLNIYFNLENLFGNNKSFFLSVLFLQMRKCEIPLFRMSNKNAWKDNVNMSTHRIHFFRGFDIINNDKN